MSHRAVGILAGLFAAGATLLLAATFALGLFPSEAGLMMALGAAAIVGFVAGAMTSLCVRL